MTIDEKLYLADLIDEYGLLLKQKTDAWKKGWGIFKPVSDEVSPRMSKLASEIDAVITGKTMTAVAAGIARNMDDKPVDMEVPF